MPDTSLLVALYASLQLAFGLEASRVHKSCIETDQSTCSIFSLPLPIVLANSFPSRTCSDFPSRNHSQQRNGTVSWSIVSPYGLSRRSSIKLPDSWTTQTPLPLSKSSRRRPRRKGSASTSIEETHNKDSSTPQREAARLLIPRRWLCRTPVTQARSASLRYSSALLSIS